MQLVKFVDPLRLDHLSAINYPFSFAPGVIKTPIRYQSSVINYSFAAGVFTYQLSTISSPFLGKHSEFGIRYLQLALKKARRGNSLRAFF